jgi:hypothetical protein
MTKKNKWNIVPFIIIAALTVLFLYYITVRKPSKPAEPLKAIPLSASVIIRVNDFNALFEKITHNNNIWNELQTIPPFNRVKKQLYFLDSMMRSDPEVSEILEKGPSYISAHVTGKDRISLMHVLQLPPHIQERKINGLISRFLIHSGTIQTRIYEGINLHEVALLDESDVGNFCYAVYRDILMISFSTTVLEDAIRQLQQPESLITDKGFNKIVSVAGKNVDANVFINFAQFPRSLSVFVRPDYKSEVRSLKNFASWGELDVNLLPDVLLMNGFIQPSDSLPSFAKVLMGQSSQRIRADEMLPSSVAACLSMSISNPGKYFDDYHAFLRGLGKYTTYNNTLQSLNNAYGIQLPDDLSDLMDEEITLAFDNPRQTDSGPDVYILLRIKSKSQAEGQLKSMLEKMAVVDKKSPDAYQSHYAFDAELNFTLYHFPVHQLISKVYGDLFSALDEHYFVLLDNYLVFSGSERALKYLIQNYILNKTLQNDPAYKEFKNNLSPRSNLVIYGNLSKSQGVFSDYLIETIGKSWFDHLGIFQKIQSSGIQIVANNDMLYSNIVLKYLSAYHNAAETVWESKLDTLALMKPVFVINHQTQQNEVFVQDMNNNIYLINQAGRILWKIPLAERINSDIFQIDYFRNRKLQLVFSTRNEIYMIDRNGNFVEKYPVKLRSPATCGLSVFDYDETRDYRLFIACEDKRIYAYTGDGNLLSGWAFNETESEVTQPVNHFRIGDKDFLVFGDRLKTYILDRKGNTRVQVETYFTHSANNNYLLNLPVDGTNPSIVTTDTTGKAYFIGFTGEVRTLDFGSTYTNRHFFDVRDLNGDGQAEFIYLEGTKLTVYNADKSKLFTYKFEEPILSKPMVYQFSATDRKLGIVSKFKNQIYLINNNGELYKGFPLQGNTSFSIGNFGDSLSRFNLVVGSRDNYLYNYRVQ